MEESAQAPVPASQFQLRFEERLGAFVDEYLRTGRAMQAARLAWTSESDKKLHSRASAILKSPRVMRMLRDRLPQRDAREQARVYGLLQELQAEFLAKYREEPSIANARLALNATEVLAEACGLMAKVSIDASKQIQQTVNTIKIELVDKVSSLDRATQSSARCQTRASTEEISRLDRVDSVSGDVAGLSV